MKHFWILMILVGCATATQESIDKRYDREYEQAVRNEEIFIEQKICKEHSGTVMIQRRGGLTRAQAATGIMGRWDTWYCMNER